MASRRRYLSSLFLMFNAWVHLLPRCLCDPLQRMQALSQETIRFADVLCQLYVTLRFVICTQA